MQAQKSLSLGSLWHLVLYDFEHLPQFSLRERGYYLPASLVFSIFGPHCWGQRPRSFSGDGLVPPASIGVRKGGNVAEGHLGTLPLPGTQLQTDVFFSWPSLKTCSTRPRTKTQCSSSPTLALPRRPPRTPCRHPATLPIMWVSPGDRLCTSLPALVLEVLWGSRWVAEVEGLKLSKEGGGFCPHGGSDRVGGSGGCKNILPNFSFCF